MVSVKQIPKMYSINDLKNVLSIKLFNGKLKIINSIKNVFGGSWPSKGDLSLNGYFRNQKKICKQHSLVEIGQNFVQLLCSTGVDFYYPPAERTIGTDWINSE